MGEDCLGCGSYLPSKHVRRAIWDLGGDFLFSYRLTIALAPSWLKPPTLAMVIRRLHTEPNVPDYYVVSSSSIPYLGGPCMASSKRLECDKYSQKL